MNVAKRARTRTLTVFVLAALMLFAFAACSGGDGTENTPNPSPDPTPQTSPVIYSGDDDRTETPSTPSDEQSSVIVDMMEVINNRGVIEDRYLDDISLDAALVERLREYNELTITLTEFFTEQAANVLIAITEIYHPPVSPDTLDEMIAHVSNQSLYKDCTERFLEDPLLYPIIEREAGGSAGMWPYTWHTFYLDSRQDMKTLLDEYFELVESIVHQLNEP